MSTRLYSVSALMLLVLSAASHADTRVGSAPYRASATGAGNSHSPVFSADGKHIAFVSHANNLVTNDDLGPHLDLFVRDLATSNTVLVTVSTNGFGGANDNIGLYSLSSNAMVIAFDTTANNLTSGDTNRVSDIYTRDLLSGTTLLLTPNANGPSSNPLISENGRYVIFESVASNLVTNDFNGTNDIFIHDLMTGLTELVTMNADGTASPDGPSSSPSISADGLIVAFISHATNLVENLVHARPEVYARDVARRINLRAAADININAINGSYPPAFSYAPNSLVVSKSGRYASFQTPGQFIRYDLHRPTNFVTSYSNATPPAVALVYYSFADNPRLVSGLKGSSPGGFVIGSDGRFMVHETAGNWLGQRGLVYTDLETLQSITFEIEPWGCCGLVTKTIPLMGVALSNALYFPQTWSNMNLRKITGDGSQVYYMRDSASRTNGQTIWTTHFYVLNTSNRIERLLLSPKDVGQDLAMGDVIPAISEDGKYIAWDSADDSLVSDDLNRSWDVFVRNVDTGETQLISGRHPDLPAASGIALSRLDLNPGAISANGQRIAVLSLDSTLVANDTNLWRDVVVRDLVTGTNIDVSRSIIPFNPSGGPTNFPGTNTAAAPFLSADGRILTFAGETSFGVQGTNRIIYRRDLQTSSNLVVASGDSVSLPVLSANARFVAFHSSGNHDLFYFDSNNQSDVFLLGSRVISSSSLPPFDCQLNPLATPPRFVSTAWAGNTTADGPSVNPAFSPDSSWILFQSLARNLLENPLPTQSSYQLYARSFVLTNRLAFDCRGQIDVLENTPTQLISYSTTASPGPSGISTDLPLPGGGANPRFSADSRYVAFESSPNLIYRHDLLGGWVTKIITHPDPWFPSFTNRARFTNDLVCSNCFNPTLNTDGRYVAYETLPAPGSIRGISVKDLQTGQEESISVSLTGVNGNGPSSTPLISHDARFVVFASRASDLVPGDNNRAMDIFVRDRLNGVTHCLSRSFAGTGTGNRVSSNPIMAADGRTVAFQSFAGDLVLGDYNETRDVFVVTLGGPDTDGDHMDDDWEMAYFSTLSRDGSGDFDSDGSSDLAEFRAGTNPANDASILRVLQLTTAVIPESFFFDRSRQTILLWSAVPGRTYRLEWRPTVSRPWEPVGVETVATGVSASASHTMDLTFRSDYPHGFYRVLLVQ